MTHEDDSLAIKKRFFTAIAWLAKEKRPDKKGNTLGGYKSFATVYGLNQGNFFTLRHNDAWLVPPGYLAWLSKDWGISGRWLLTGEGVMLAAQKSPLTKS